MLNHLLNLRIAFLMVAVLLAIFGIGNAFVALFLPASHEVTYQFSVSANHCLRRQCAYSAMLEIANSGRELQQEVLVTIRGLPEGAGGSPRTINLDASRPRESDPLISQERQGEALRIRLQQFSPGTLTQIYFSGFFAADDLVKAAEPEVHVEGRGRLIEADPRSIAFGRWFTATGTPVDPERS